MTNKSKKEQSEQVPGDVSGTPVEEKGTQQELSEDAKSILQENAESEKEKEERINLLILERPSRTERVIDAKRLLASGIHLRARNEGQYVKKGQVITTVQELVLFEAQTSPESETWYQALLVPNQKYPNGLVCLDIDDPEVWTLFLGLVSAGVPELEGAIINHTYRGGHIIYQAERIEKNSIKATLNIGVGADVLTNAVTVFGPGKYISHMPLGEFVLPIIPFMFQKSTISKVFPIIQGGPILEGFRNDTIFKWVNGKLKCDIPTKQAIAGLMGSYFCRPPLDYIESTSTVRDTFVDQVDNGNSSANEIAAQQVIQDTKFIKGQLINKFAYDPEENRFYKFVGTHWNIQFEADLTLQIEFILTDNASQIASPMKANSTLSMAKIHLQRAKSYLAIPNEWRSFPAGINFKNGYLSFETQSLLPHHYSMWVRQVLDEDYNPDETITYECQQIFVQSCGGNKHGINALFSCIYRALVTMSALETGYYFYGPPGTGKSLMTSFIMVLLGLDASACEVGDLDNAFTRCELIPKKVLVFNELMKLSAKDEKHLKSLQGRDSQTSEVKFIQGYSSQKFLGIVILVSNLSPS